MPSAAIITTAFVSAADLMARALGAVEYPFVETPHPISSAPSAELAHRARDATDRAVRLLLTEDPR